MFTRMEKTCNETESEFDDKIQSETTVICVSYIMDPCRSIGPSYS